MRVAQWVSALKRSGHDVAEMALSPSVASAVRAIDHLAPVASGRAALETLAWSGRDLRRMLDTWGAEGIVFITLRSADARLVSGRRHKVVVDFVDELSRSYRQRASLDPQRGRAAGWRMLSWSMRRAERATVSKSGVVMVAAGRGDAEELRARWIPITIADEVFRQTLPRERRWDAVFSGTLDYPPNVAALRWLCAEIWPAVSDIRPDTTLVIAGRRPTPEVRRLVDRIGAELVADYDTQSDPVPRSRVALAPLRFATGIQIKVLEAAARRIPQVVTPEVMRGLDAGFPARVAAHANEFARALVELVDNPKLAEEQANRAFAHARDQYSARAWDDTMAACLAEPLP